MQFIYTNLSHTLYRHSFSDQLQFFCPQCSVVQEVDSKFNYFHILNIDDKFDVKAKLLQKTFTNLQVVLKCLTNLL